jgi:hypothetical protein
MATANQTPSDSTARGKPLGKTTASTDPNKVQEVTARLRKVQYKIVCAAKNLPYVEGASHLKGLPYVIANAASGAAIYPKQGGAKSFATFSGKHLCETVVVNVPEDVEEVAIFLGNDAYATRRRKPLFKLKPAESGATVVTLYETYLADKKMKIRQDEPDTRKSYPKAGHGQAASAANERSFVGYLTGDVWADFSHEYTVADIKRLCHPATMKRIFAADSGRGPVPQPGGLGETAQPPTDEQRRLALAMGIPRAAADATYVAPSAQQVLASSGAFKPVGGGLNGAEIAKIVGATSAGDTAGALKPGADEVLEIKDWVQVLAPIYSQMPDGLTDNRAQGGGVFHLPIVNIRLRFAHDSFANAILTSERTTVQQVLRRTSPLAYKAIVEAAWKSGVDVVQVTSTWRPILGSMLHRMGVALDVNVVDDLDDKQPEFQVNLTSGKEPTKVYAAFQKEVWGNPSVPGFKADPWKREPSDNLHKNHLHVTASNPDAS